MLTLITKLNLIQSSISSHICGWERDFEYSGADVVNVIKRDKKRDSFYAKNVFALP